MSIRRILRQFNQRLFRSRVHLIKTKGQFDQSKGYFNRRVDDKNYSFVSVQIKIILVVLDEK